MKTLFARGLAVALLVALVMPAVPAFAAQKSTGPDRQGPRLIKTPQTPEEFWNAARFYLNVGQQKDALEYLERFLQSDPTPELLIEIRERDGAEIFPKMSATPELHEKRKAVEALANTAAQQAARKPERILKFIDYLTRSPAHRSYGIAQLRSAGADAVPYLLDALRNPTAPENHAVILRSMQQLDTAVVPPLVAALESDEPNQLIDVIALLAVLGDKDTVPRLRYIAEAPQTPKAIQAAARSAVERILDVDYADLPAAADALLAQANRHYRRQVDLHVTGDDTVRLWRWIPREGVRAEPVNSSYANEYFGLGHCRQALALNPNHEPAQILMLSLALEKASDRVGIDQSLPEGPGRASASALAAGPALLSKVFLRALDEGHPAVAVAAARALAETGDLNLLTAQHGRPSPLVQALSTPDPRIQFAAAEAVLGLRPQQPYPGISQVISILSRALTSQGAAKALVIDHNNLRGSALSSLLREAGYEGQLVTNARDGFALAAESGGYQLIFVDPNIQEPNLSPALASLRGDPRTAGIPIIVLGELAVQQELTKFERRYARVKYFLRPTTIDTLKQQLEPMLAGLQSKPLTPAERTEQARAAAAWFARIARGEIRGLDPRPAERELLSVLGDDSLGPDAIAAVSLMPSPQGQTALAELVANDSAPMPLRLEAAKQLKHSLKQFGLMVRNGQAAALIDLLDRTQEPVFHQAVAAVIGAMKPSSAEVGQRLRRLPTPPFQPTANGTPPGASQPEKPAVEEPKAPAAPVEKPPAEPAAPDNKPEAKP